MQRRTLLGAALAMPAIRPVKAQSWPARSVNVIVPYPPGGGTDGAGRIMAAALQERLGQPFVIDNRGGAGGMVGTKAVGRAAPDGYTLLFNGTFSILRDGWDPRDDVKDVAMAIASHNLLVVNKTVPVTTAAEFIEYAKARPNRLNHGTAGILSAQHLAEIMFSLSTGAQVETVHYRGTGPAVAGLLANEVQFLFGSMSAVEPLIRAGEIRILATASARRSVIYPDVPTMQEIEPKYVPCEQLYVFSAPLGTPEAIRTTLAQAVRASLANTDMLARMRVLGFEPMYMEGDELAKQVNTTIAFWTDTVKRAGIRLE
jgi:tripartite-type tricarboxylate transporter receptor subunit TctC